jgi:hypothetical protein
MAKDKLEKSFRILVDNSAGNPADITEDLIPGSIVGGGVQLDQVDMTGVSRVVKSYLAGHGDAPITAQFHMNAASTGAFGVINGKNGGVGTVTLQYGKDGAAPTTADPEWEGEYTYFMTPVSASGGRMVFSATFMPAPAAADPAWGTV